MVSLGQLRERTRRVAPRSTAPRTIATIAIMSGALLLVPVAGSVPAAVVVGATVVVGASVGGGATVVVAAAVVVAPAMVVVVVACVTVTEVVAFEVAWPAAPALALNVTPLAVTGTEMTIV